MPATMKDIARETGLGLATISKYLNGGNVRDENRAAIDAAITKLDYRVNHLARGLKSNRSRTIGVVIPELSNLFITSIITVVEEHLRAKGYSVVICDCHTDEKLECEAVRFLLDKMVDGIINMPVCRNGRHLQPALARQLPVVLIDRMVPELAGQASAVLIDNVAAARMATDCLLGQGHRDIGIVLGPQRVYTSEQRLQGYTQAFARRGLTPDPGLILYSDYSMQGGSDSIRRLLAPGHRRATAAFMTNYEMTLGAVIAINEMGVAVPGALSLIGFDNMQLSQVVHPRLTIITQPLEEIGAQAAATLLQHLAGKAPGAPVSITLSPALQPGASVGPPAAHP